MPLKSRGSVSDRLSVWRSRVSTSAKASRLAWRTSRPPGSRVARRSRPWTAWSEARRFDRSTGTPWTLKVRQRYRYDASNQRIIKQTLDLANPVNGAADARVALYVIPGDFERRGLRANGASYEAIAASARSVRTKGLFLS